MLRTSSRCRWPHAFGALVILTLLGVVGCDQHHQTLAGISAGNLPPGKVDDPCASHQTGCACTVEGSTVDCGSVKETVGSYVICTEGARTCTSGQWGDCVADHEEKKPLSFRAPMQGGYTAQALGSSASCNNLCDPGCQQFVDDATGLTVDPDLTATSDGVSLPAAPGGGGTCNNVTVTPAMATVTISAIATDGTITATPTNGKVDFDATCSGGAAIEPSWTIDSYDRAAISPQGVVTVYSGVAGPIQVTGQASGDSDTATLNVNVAIGPALVAAGSTTEVGKTLYPYNGTLFPLGLKSPLVQWSEGGITPTQVQVILCYPKTTCATFQYAKTYTTEPRDGGLDSTVPAWQIPQEIWSAFDRTAAGDTGQIIIRRQAGATKYQQLALDVKFATDALRGTVYYTQYLRALSTSDGSQTFSYTGSSYTPGQTCQVGNNTHPSTTAGSQTRAIDLSTSAATNIDPFAKGGYTAGCPVCHSISADGGTAVSGGQYWQTSGGGNGLGINSIGVDSMGAPAFTGLFGAPDYSVVNTASSETSGEDSRGFSYAAITPDGAMVLQGPTFWGSTSSTPAANNTQIANLTGVAGGSKPYFFADTDTPNPGFGVQFATTGPLTYTASGSGSTYTLTGTGTLTLDGVSMNSTAYSVLVKDETGANAKNNGVYTVSATSPWKLKLRSDAYAAGTIKAQSEVRVSDGAVNRGNVYYVSAPASGTITPGSTALTFSQRVYPPMVFGGTPHNTGYATTGALTPATVTQSGNVLTGGAPAALVVDGHTMAVGETVLVKDQTSQVQNGTYTLTTLGVGGTGTPTTAAYATTTSLPANTLASGVLTGTANGPLPAIDGITPAVGDTILVKNEGTGASNGVYTVTTLGVTGSGTPLGATLCATTAALPANTNSAGVLTGTNFGAIGAIDGVTLAVGNRILVKNEATQANNGVYAVTSLGLGGSVSHTAAKVATTGPLPANTIAGNVITGSAWGALPQIDGVTVSSSGPDRVLVMNEATAANNGIYTVTNAGTGTNNVHTAVRVGTTASLPTNTSLAGVLSASAYGALSIDGVAVTGGDRVLVKNEVTQTNNGIYTVTTAGLGTGTTRTAVVAATTTALPGYTAAGSVLTASSFGALAIDGVTFTGGERVLVQDEGTPARNGIYTVTTAGTGTGLVHTAARVATTVALPANTNTAGVLTPTAFGPIPTVDGQTLNTGDRVLVKNETATQNNGIYTVTGLGNGTSTVPTGGNVRVATTGNLAASRSGSVLTASANGKLTTIDGVTPIAVNDRVLVMNQTLPVDDGIYTVTSIASTTTKWTMTRAADTLTGGMQIGVNSGTANGGKTFFISTPVSGAITLNSTSMGFTQSVQWSLTRATDGTTGQLSGGDLVPITAGTTYTGFTFYVSTPASGLITVNTTGISFSQSAKWVLTRAADALAGGDLVPVTGGGTNDGLTFYISTPATGAITLNTTPITFSQSAKWVLTRAVETLAVGDQVPITNGTVNTNTTYYLSTPTSGVIVAGVTAIGFSLSSKWSLTRATDGVTGQIAVGDEFPVTSGTTNGGKTFYVSTPTSGTITVNTTAIGFSQASKWVLTRTGDANTSVQVFPGLQVPVTSGTANGGKTYYISTPVSGTITLNSTSIAFSVEVAWQLTRKAPYTAGGGGLVVGLQVTVSGGSTNASKTFYISTPSTGTITVDSTATTWSLGVNWQLTRTTDADSTGEITPGMEVKVANGAANSGRVFYVSSPTNGSIAINTTGILFSYGLPSMMAPVVSPDGTKIAYVNGDADVDGGLTETGWRRGLSMFSFDQATMTVSNKKRLLNNWTAATPGTPVKWPFFEGDSRSLLYVETDPNEYCSSAANAGTCNTVPTDTYAAAVCTGTSGTTSVNTSLERSCFQAAYGSMSPTTRGFFPGRIFSIDTSASNPSTTRVELANLDDTDHPEDTTDQNKAYQPTVLPFTAGGKRWVIFTSPRAYGNQFNQKSSTGTPTDFSCAASMLWVAALDDTVANGTDRSHPAFFMPGQQVAKITTANHFVNERGYIVPSPCKTTGTSCSVDEECCGSDDTPATAACRAPAGWDPATGAPAKTCEALSGTCHNAGQSCSTPADCCNSNECVNYECAAGGHYTEATFTREYVANCPSGQLPVWTLYSYHLTTGGDSQLQFSAQTSDDLSTLDAATVVSLGSSSGDTVSPMAPESIDVGAALDAAKVSKNLENLRILVKLVPSSDSLIAPTLHDWQMVYTCTDQL
jgi:hypothetical protein